MTTTSIQLRPTDPATETFRGTPAVRARDLAEWRGWLAEHGETHARIWLIIFTAGSDEPTVGYREAIEHALCFGWVDSLVVKRDDTSCYLSFSPRNPRSTWSATNRERAERMTRLGFMRQPGMTSIELAIRTGRWEPPTTDRR
ncbi:MAG TPA: hypothetical protein VIT20_08885 [Propionibacteriaceae bacterium]